MVPSRHQQRLDYQKNPVAIELLRSSGAALRPPAEVLFDLERRSAQPRTLTQEFCGDPDPLRRTRMAELEQQRRQRLYADRARRWASTGALILIGAIVASASPAQAKFHGRYAHHHFPFHHRHNPHSFNLTQGASEGWGWGAASSASAPASYARENWVPPPHKRCGYTARMALGVRDPAYNLARNWKHYGSPANGPCVGCIAVSNGHVARIVGQENGRWMVADDRGNHPMSLGWATTYRK